MKNQYFSKNRGGGDPLTEKKTQAAPVMLSAGAIPTHTEAIQEIGSSGPIRGADLIFSVRRNSLMHRQQLL
jgi:hypothetical protein